jgi:hypothetical protein
MSQQNNKDTLQPGFRPETIYTSDVLARIRNSPQVPAAEQRPQTPVFKSDNPPELKVRHK